MKKTRIFAAAVFILILGVGALMWGCGDTPPPPKELPKVKYGIEDAVPTKDANSTDYAASKTTADPESLLKDMTFYWLGSSVTYGSASQGESMADYLAAMTGCKSVKEAVSGTTLYDDGGGGDSGARSYTRRLTTGKNFDKSAKIDAFICQISTNDARNDRLSKWGEITADNVTAMDSFDRKTTLGGVEYIIAYATEYWNCPVYFYSGGYFGDDGNRKSTNPTGTNYGKLVAEVKKVAEKWQKLGYQVGVIDLYNDSEFNAKTTDEYYAWCMSDAIHPKRAGYLQWWTPYFENFLTIHVAMGHSV